MRIYCTNTRSDTLSEVVPLRSFSMRCPVIKSIAVGLLLFSQQAICQPDQSPIAIAIHGGAGTISRDSMTAERERVIRGVLEEAIRAGYDVLERDGAAIDAVTATITIP